VAYDPLVTTRIPDGAALRCPRCASTLQPAATNGGLSCGACHGVFVFRDALEAVLAESATLGGAASYRQAARPAADAGAGRGAYEPAFRYLLCPQCNRTMNRQNFMKRSGVIVDVCLHHGTWFDDDEARRAGAFIAAGGTAPEEPTSRRASTPPLSGGTLLLEALSRITR
jgi:Zn-finger nucleic acid-binding protein